MSGLESSPQPTRFRDATAPFVSIQKTLRRGTGRSQITTASGTNCVGTPCGNDRNAFFNSTFFGANFTSTSNEGQPYDYSMGVVGNVVPEPATLALLTCGLGALLIAVRRQRAA